MVMACFLLDASSGFLSASDILRHGPGLLPATCRLMACTMSTDDKSLALICNSGALLCKLFLSFLKSLSTAAPGCSAAGVHGCAVALRSVLRRAMAVPGSDAAGLAWHPLRYMFEQIEQSLYRSSPASVLHASTAALDVLSRADVLPRQTAALDKGVCGQRLDGGRPVGDGELPRAVLAGVAATGRALTIYLRLGAVADGVPEHAPRLAALREVDSVWDDPSATTVAQLRRHAVAVAEVFEAEWRD